jgi:hypothetical protein
MKQMVQQDMFDSRLSRRLRDDGMASAESEADDWKLASLRAFMAFGNTGIRHFITEDFRKWWMDRGDYFEPRHHNAWGAFTASMLKGGLIRPTGRVRAAASVKSHARKMLEWEIVGRVS